MPPKIAPPASAGQIEPKPVVQPSQIRQPIKDPTFRLTDEELFLFDGYAQELNQIAGTPIDYYNLNPDETLMDPLYNEPIAWDFAGPFRFPAWVEYPQKKPESSETGLHATWDAMCWISRKEFEENDMIKPQEGDVLQIWNTPFFQDFSTNDIIPIPGAGYYYDVTTVVEDGHVNDQASFVGYKLTLKRRTEFTPERKITPP